jgi:hypothetical protein
MLNFAEQTGSGAVILVLSFLTSFDYTHYINLVQNRALRLSPSRNFIVWILLFFILAQHDMVPLKQQSTWRKVVVLGQLLVSGRLNRSTKQVYREIGQTRILTVCPATNTQLHHRCLWIPSNSPGGNSVGSKSPSGRRLLAQFFQSFKRPDIGIVTEKL